MDRPDHRLAAIAASQHGVFTAAQAKACGISRRTLDQRADGRQLNRAHPGVYVLAGSPDTWRRRTITAVFSLGDRAAASHRTAAELWGMTSLRAPAVEVVTTRWDRLRRSPIVVHESTDLIDDDIVHIDGIPVTTATRTVVDLGASTSKSMVAACVDTALRKRLFTIREVDQFVARVARKGRRGVGVIRPIIEERAGWDGVTESELEDRFRRVVTEAGLPMPVSQYVVKDRDGLFVCRADFAYPERRLLIELDSEAFHMDRTTFRSDRSKQNEALALGWRTLRFTWHDLMRRRAEVLRVLADI